MQSTPSPNNVAAEPNPVFITRWAERPDAEAIIELLPRLADFDLPPRRDATVFWHGDAALVRTWAKGGADSTFLRVATDADQRVIAAAMVTLNEDHFDHELNAHLEAIVVDPSADGFGIGRQLIRECQTEARSRGARTMSLHVMGNNARARAVYETLGFHEEMIRAVTFLDKTAEGADI